MIARRPGTKYVSTTKDSSSARLIPFKYNDDQAYAVEFGDQYLRFYRDDGQVQATGTNTITTASWSAGVATYTSASHTIGAGDVVTVSGITPSGYNVSGIVQSTTTNTFALNIAADPGSYSSGGTTDSPYQIESPWPEADVDGISYVQSADILYCFHPNYAPRQIARTGADLFSVSAFEIANGPFDSISETARLTISVTAHNATLVDNTEYRAGLAANDYQGDEAGEHVAIIVSGDGFSWDHDGINGTTGKHIGRLIKYKWDNEDFAVALIYQTINSTTAYAMVLQKGGTIATQADISPAVVDKDEWYLGDFYGSFEDTSHRRALIAGAAHSSGTTTITCARKHTLQVGDAVEIEFLESATDINGSYTVLGSGLTDTAFQITSANPGTVTADTGNAVVPEFLSNTSQEGSSTDMNQPAIPAFYQQRMWLGRTTQNVNRIYASRTGDFANFQEASLLNDEAFAVVDTDSLLLTIDDDQVNEIRWIRSVARGLLIGTNGAEYVLMGSRTSEVITPSNVQVQRQTDYGSAPNVRPELVGRSLLFAHRSTTRILELAYSLEADQQIGKDVSIVSEHLLKPGVKAMAFQEVPVRTLWIVMDDGSVVTFVYEKEQDVLGWTKCEFGGSGLAESVVALPESDEDSIWFVVNRGGTRTIEVMKPPFDTDSEQVDAWYVDNGLAFDRTNTTSSALLTFTATTYTTGSTGTLTATAHTPFAGTAADLDERYRLFAADGSWYDVEITVADTTSSCTARVLTSGFPTELQATATSSWANLTDSFSGLEHMASQTASVFADGGSHEDVSVSSTGTVTLNNLHHKGVIGYGYTTTIKSLPIRVLQYFTETRGKAQALYAAEIQLWKSLGGEVDFGDTAIDIAYRETATALGTAPGLETGIIEMAPANYYDSQARVNIVISEPVPFNLLSMVYEIDINDQI